MEPKKLPIDESLLEEVGRALNLALGTFIVHAPELHGYVMKVTTDLDDAINNALEQTTP